MAISRWSEEKSVKFVSVYENYECLWNSRCNEYKNREARATAVRKLICDMSELGVEMSEEDVKTRIKTIRTTYMSELRKVEKAQKSGASTDDLYKPTCAWFKDADRFLRKVVSLRSVFENLNSQTTQDVISEENNNTPISEAGISNVINIVQPTTPSTERTETIINTLTALNIPPNRGKKRSRQCNNDVSLTAVNKLQKICDSAGEFMKDDEFEIFGKHVATQLRNMAILRAIDIQTQINTILSRARIQDIKDKENDKTNSQASQLRIYDTDDSASSYWVNTPHSISDSAHSHTDSEEQSAELHITRDILSQALNSIM